ncbi:MAG: transposase [Proteobacteria bacterium]|nr:transposase [Pseudomonadota bacterium]MBS0548051.1 transposase [Pseudomonadota bacterium]
MEHKGWHSRGYLPHFDSPETIQFITFRLADSLPRHVVESLKATNEYALALDRELDSGLGACWLREPRIAEVVQNALLHFDGQRYRLMAWCLMPNHVHVVAEAIDGYSLTDVVRGWKSFSARRANEMLGRTGRFWDPDYFDRYMRDEEHLHRTIEYVEHNPVKARLVAATEEWAWSSAAARLG